jgi:predicted dehydrogenase
MKKENSIIPKETSGKITFSKPVTAIVIGAGERGMIYSGYSKKNPDELKIIGVAEPVKDRRGRFAKQYEIPKKYQWSDWKNIFDYPKIADVLIISTPDNVRSGPVLEGLKAGYDLLLEKPIAQSWQECNEILKYAKKSNRIVAICHVLRYTPYFRKMKELINSGVIGDIVSIQHMEQVGYIHMSFVCQR